MRQLLAAALTAAAALVAMPAVAAATEPPQPDGCFVSSPDAPESTPGSRAVGAVLTTRWDRDGKHEGAATEEKLEALLGDQFAGAWFDSALDGWGVGLAPGRWTPPPRER